MYSEFSADVTAGQPGATMGRQGAGRSQGAATPGVVTRTGAGLAAGIGTNQGNVGSKLNAGSMDPDRGHSV